MELFIREEKKFALSLFRGTQKSGNEGSKPSCKCGRLVGKEGETCGTCKQAEKEWNEAQRRHDSFDG